MIEGVAQIILSHPFPGERQSHGVAMTPLECMAQVRGWEAFFDAGISGIYFKTLWAKHILCKTTAGIENTFVFIYI